VHCENPSSLIPRFDTAVRGHQVTIMSRGDVDPPSSLDIDAKPFKELVESLENPTTAFSSSNGNMVRKKLGSTNQRLTQPFLLVRVFIPSPLNLKRIGI
jgi:hypothetical protein